MSKRHVKQRFRQWAEMPRNARVDCEELTIVANSPEEAKVYMEEQCRQAFAGESIVYSVEIIDGNVQVFFHNK